MESFAKESTFAGRYRIVGRLAAGGMGAIYEVTHLVTGRRCALKVMLHHTIDRATLRDRFLQEARVAAQIQSRHIVDVLDAGVDEASGSPFLVMELLDGEDLARRLSRLGRLSPQEAVDFLWQTALALDRLHRAGVVHRDLKPSNLFVAVLEDGESVLKVLDFGVAKILPTDVTAEPATREVGTPLYMAPEQFSPDGRISALTDIYSLAHVAYALLVGHHYWKQERDRAENPFAFASLVAHGPSERASERARRFGVVLPPAFDEWFARAAAELPANRFAGATDAVAALASAFHVPVPELAEDSRVPSTPITSDTFASVVPPPTEEQSAQLAVTNLEAISLASSPSADGPLALTVTEGEGDLPSGIGSDATVTSLSVTGNGARPAPRRARVFVAASAIAAVGIFAAVMVQQREASSPSASDSSSSETPPTAKVEADPAMRTEGDPGSRDPEDLSAVDPESIPAEGAIIDLTTDAGLAARPQPSRRASPPEPKKDPEPDPTEARERLYKRR